VIRIDPRAGSCELIAPLRKIGYEVKVEEMSFGDLAFKGNGPLAPMQIGIEYKKMEDLIQCLNDDRFLGHQLPGMLALYDRAYLVVEGTPLWQSDGGFKNYEGTLHRWRRSHSNITLRRLLSAVMKIEELGCRTIFMASQSSALTYITTLHDWWQKKWEEHSKKVYMHTPTLNLIVPSLRQKVAILLPGIGHQKLSLVADNWTNTRSMINASREDWLRLRGIGSKTADSIQEVLDGE
jgi:ERCC4-type nuclease